MVVGTDHKIHIELELSGAEDLPTFGEKTREIFMLKKIAMFYLPVTQNEPIFSISASPNSTEITKLQTK